MKRYNIGTKKIGTGYGFVMLKAIPIKKHNGTWVKYSDVEPLIRELCENVIATNIHYSHSGDYSTCSCGARSQDGRGFNHASSCIVLKAEKLLKRG